MQRLSFKNWVSLIVVFALIVGSVSTQAAASQKTLSDYQQEIEEYESQLAKLEGKSGSEQEYQRILTKQIKAIDGQMDLYQSDVDALSEKVTAKELEISDLNDDILQLESDIEAKQAEIDLKEEEKQETLDLLKERMRADYMSGNTSIVELLMGSSDFGELMSSIEYMKRIAAYDGELAADLEEQISTIEEGKQEIETNLETLSGQKEQMSTELDALEVEKNEVTAIKANLQSAASSIQSKLDKSIEKNGDLLAISNQVKNINSSDEQYESTGSGDYTGDYDPGSDWGWPLPGYSITSGYGSRNGSFHYGVDFPAPTGTSIVASKSGTVVASTYGVSGGGYGGFGNVVVIDHGNGYLTLYAHMSQRLVSVGQSVSKGQTIGLVGNTGNSYGSHLHFEVRTSSGSRLDPKNFL